jgi:two-component system, sensor histidine kinase YesM
MKMFHTKYIHKINISYKSKLIISYLVLASIPFTFGCIFLYISLINSISTNFNQITNRNIDQELVSINSKLNDIEKTGYLLLTNSTINKFLKVNYYSDIQLVETINNDVMPMISWISSTNKEFSNFRFFTDNKSIPENQFFNQSRPYEQENWFVNMERQLTTHTNYWEPSHISRTYTYFKSDGRIAYSLFYPSIINYYNQKAYLEINVDAETLFGDTVKRSPLTNSYFIIVDGTGNYISGKNSSINELLKKNEVFISSLKENKSSFSLKLNKSGYYINMRKMERLDSFIVGIVPVTVITEPLNHEKYIFIFILFIAIIIIYFLSSFLANLLHARIKRMLEAVKKIQLGNFNINIPVYGTDEIDELAKDINIMANKINDLINKVYKSEIAQKETAIYALQAQINPHFLFNTLETFKMMAEINGQEDLSEGITSLGNLMRYNISIGKKFVAIEKELEIIQDYIQIQNLLLNNRIKFEYYIPEELMKCKMPILVMQPLVENSILHGFMDKPGIVHIKICIIKNEDDIVITVSDNGAGITPDRLSQIEDELKGIKNEENFSSREKSIGLVNVNNRLLLNFGEKYGLTVGNAQGGGFKATIRLPSLVCR